jgi:hypothetical protein
MLLCRRSRIDPLGSDVVIFGEKQQVGGSQEQDTKRLGLADLGGAPTGDLIVDTTRKGMWTLDPIAGTNRSKESGSREDRD